ncbi:nucleoside hydrolase [Phytoactinopolyspora alkaliphila]|uniref:Nucleoside hydrolase n=1 Tax=Phytoactinopolyspora alkaliphila TaxID=1783498 RepID=A0A6N9YLY3_9ACTN|nr:nucleoside hydrolase [Phytoactinopolyspora alkaliphila]NED95868.1 nucleoside hydrolase [Phytoactinopolyspora alkaliphila]
MAQPPITPPADGIGPVVLDTDIGSDVDDLLALILLADDPRVDLRGVTTVYGDVALRARMANRVLRLMGCDDVPVHEGLADPLSGRDVWWAGHEGQGIDDLEAEEISPLGGVDALIEATRQHPGQLTVVAIGPLTNVAAALERDPGWKDAVRRLVVMGGEFSRGEPEHNIRCDAAAARTVLASGIPSVFVGLDVTTTVALSESDLDEITRSGSPLATLVDQQVRGWWRFRETAGSSPHDPLAVLAMLEPDLFTLEAGSWTVIEEGERLGVLERSAGSAGVHRAVRVDVERAADSIRRRLSHAVSA